MDRSMEETVGTGPLTIYCPSCGGAMRVAPAHVNTVVACPHCEGTVEPWQAMRAGTPSPPPPPQQPATPPMYPPGVGPRTFAGPPPMYGHPNAGYDGYSWRNRWIAGALGVLLGTFGVHRFYLGFTGIGIIQILLAFPTFGLSGVWGFIEGILCFCGAMRDVDGLPLRN